MGIVKQENDTNMIPHDPFLSDAPSRKKRARDDTVVVSTHAKCKSHFLLNSEFKFGMFISLFM